MKYYLSLFLLLLSLSLSATEYHLGRGMRLSESENYILKVGGFVGAKYSSENILSMDHNGVMLYGSFLDDFNFLVEGSGDETFSYDFTSGKSARSDYYLSRAYLSYTYSDALSLKVGEFLTPLGLYNVAYIPALQWTAFKPFVADGFYPKIIVGAEVSGSFGFEEGFSYSSFYHFNHRYDTNTNNVQADEFAGTELRYIFMYEAKVALNLARYKSVNSKEISLVGGVNLLIPFYNNELSAEFIYKDGEWKDEFGALTHWKDYAWYAQYVQSLSVKNYLSFRVGQKVRFNSTKNRNWNDSNAVVGYIYKPTSALSMKLEHRYRERDGWNALKTNETLVSFGVLF